MSWNVSFVSSSALYPVISQKDAIDANETAVERDERHPDGGIVDRESEPLLGLAQLLVGGLRFLPSELLVRQQLLALVGDPPRFRDVARDGAHAEDPLAARVANEEMGVRDRDLLVRRKFWKRRLPDHWPRSIIVLRITSVTNERSSGG